MEIWKAVIDFEGKYEVSSLGRVRSLQYRNRHCWKVLMEPRILKPQKHTAGYARVDLCKDGIIVHCFIHRLVLAAFHGPCPDGHIGCHLNGDDTNNHADNLKWGTPSENEAHKRLHGTQATCEKHPHAKLTNIQALTIYRSQLPTRVLAEQYGLSQRTVQSIRRGSYWKEVTHAMS